MAILAAKQLGVERTIATSSSSFLGCHALSGHPA